MKGIVALSKQFIGDGIVVDVGLSEVDTPVCLVTMYGEHGMGEDDDPWAERWMDDVSTIQANTAAMQRATEYLSFLEEFMRKRECHFG